MFKKIIFVLLISAAYSCKKSGSSLDNNSPYPILNVHVGVSINSRDTSKEYLIGIGCTKVPEILIKPHYADYWAIKLDSTNQPILYYHTDQNFTSSDSIMFRSIEPAMKRTILAVYYFSQ